LFTVISHGSHHVRTVTEHQKCITSKHVPVCVFLGYLACAFLLRECDSLSVLLVNTIFRDLTSKNMYVVAMALSASCHLIPPDQVTVLLPVLEEKLKHPSVSSLPVIRDCGDTLIFDSKKL
jgi:hypothetical protein